MKVAFFFILDGHTLERQALLLAHSLRAHHGSDVAIIAYVPSRYLPDLSEVARDFLLDLKVEIVPLDTHGATWARGYPHGNKVLAAAQPRDCDYSIFLDTDMCCTANAVPKLVPGDTRVFACPEGLRTWGKNINDWRAAYSFFNQPLPKKRIRMARGRRKLSVPYFNAGYVAFPEVHPETGQRFGVLWLQTATALDFGAEIPNKRPWLDQISLPITMYRFGFKFSALGEDYNFSTKARKARSHTLRVAHYHRDAGFVEWPQCDAAFDAFATDMNARTDGTDYLGTRDAYLNQLVGVRARAGAVQAAKAKAEASMLRLVA